MEKDRLDLEKYQTVLLAYRARLLGDTNDLLRDGTATDGDLSRAPSHLADQGSDTAEQEMMLERLTASSATLQEIDEALERIAAGTYGICERCSREIGDGRLKVNPYASLCVECRRKQEAGEEGG